MQTEFKLPELGENIEAGDVVNILVSEGDTINVDDPVLELETDKATVEVPSSVSGVIKQIHVNEGDTVQVGQIILTTENGAPKSAASAPTEEIAAPEPAAAPSPEPEAASAAPEAETPQTSTPGVPQTMEFKLPDLGENIEQGTVVSVLVSAGDTVEVDQGVLELETDKATVEVPAPAAGTVTAIHIKEGDEVSVGQHILTMETETAGALVQPAQVAPKPEPVAAPQPAPPKAEAPEPEPAKLAVTPAERLALNTTHAVFTDGAPRPEHSLIPAAPNVRRLAREVGVDLTQVTGTGPGGRVSMDDVKVFARMMRTGPVAAPSAARPAVQPLPDFSQWGQVERQKMSNIRRATAEQMDRAWTTIPHVTQFDKADITDLEELRKRFGKKAEQLGGKLTVTAILLKVVAGALKEFSQFNASIDMANQEVVYKQYYHIGVAVDTDRGLLVPVIRNVDQKNILELAVELGEVAQKARDKKLSLDDMRGGTFTITNLGGIGGVNFTPIVNTPEVAILGVARGRKEPIFNANGQFEPRLMLPLSLSYDHRLIDGADGARFLRWIVEYLEQPFLTALQGW